MRREIEISSSLATSVLIVGHPRDRQAERQVSDENLAFVFNHPEHKEPGRNGSQVWSARIGDDLLAVVWMRKSGRILVKTTYWKD